MPVRYKDIVDGFTLSASQLYLTENYRAHCLAQMEVLRRATAYRCREYVIPKNGQVVPAYSQVEQAISVQPGSYIWGLTFTAPFGEADGLEGNYIYIQITDACTETPFFSDYVLAVDLQATAASASNRVVRNPVLLSQPRLIGEPGKIDVEVYNSFSSSINCQLMICVAEPAITPQQMAAYFEKQRIEGML